MSKEYRVVCTVMKGCFALFASRTDAMRFLGEDRKPNWARRNMTHAALLQSRDIGVTGDDSTWTTDHVTDAELRAVA